MMLDRLFDGSIFKENLSRRAFIKAVLVSAASLPILGMLPKSVRAVTVSNGRVKKGIKGNYDLVIANGDDPYAMVINAMATMGGMNRFVKKGDTVLVKPNMGWDRSPSQAGNTNPDVIAALVELSFRAGAKRVNVFDVTCNDPQRCYDSSGIMKAAKERGANVYFAEEWNSVNAHFDYPSPMEGWPILKDALECDVFINVPILKHHALTGLTISMKNLMGVCGGNRGKMHPKIGRNLVDLTDFISPDLTVVDAYRVLLRHGPTGGNLSDVHLMKKLVVATDPVLADTYAATLMGVDPMSIPNIKVASEMKFGNTDIESAHRIEI